MRTKNIKISLLSSAMLFAVLVLGMILLPMKSSFANASQGSLEIVGPNIINTAENPTNIEFTATLTGSETYNSDDIEWYYQQTLLSNTYVSQGTTTNSSTLKLPSIYYGAESSGTFVTIYARINNSNGVGAYETEKEVMILKPANPVAISVNTSFQNYNPEGVYNQFTFTIINPTITTQNVTWYLSESNGKYNPLPVQALADRYYLSVSGPGNYTVIAKVDNQFSSPITAKVYHATISSLFLNYEVVDKNDLGFDIYKFTLQGLTENHDLANINWYRKGYSTPLQYGGDTFLFDPNFYATYQIFARYEQNEIESNSFLLEIKIDRTLEIIIFYSIIVGIMSVGLVILIYRNIKKDKVWWYILK